MPCREILASTSENNLFNVQFGTALYNFLSRSMTILVKSDLVLDLSPMNLKSALPTSAIRQRI